MRRRNTAGVAAAVAATLLGVVAVISLASSGGTGVNPVTSRSAPTKPVLTDDGQRPATITAAPPSIAPAAGGAPGKALSITPPARPTAEDVQRILAGITAEIMAPPGSTATTQPLTKEQVDQEVRSKLSQLGINF
ncbi:MAG: hypothetical protein M3Y04_03920 [Actinomycetota bacterium]|nr:hypothetical protein [Actinomycetota bacterium]